MAPRWPRVVRFTFPPQTAGDETRTEQEYDDPAGVVPGFDDDAEDAESEAPEPPPRRRTGGIRGRSYESPANL